jgi:hypothetical protein
MEGKEGDEIQEAVSLSLKLSKEIWDCLLFAASISEDFSAKFRSGPFSLEIRKRYDGRVEVSYSVRSMDGTERIIRKVY